jgi:hypothetical protein
MANVKVVLLPIAITNYLVINVQAVNDLGPAVVGDISFAPPHPQRNFTVPDVPPIMLRFFFWESVDGVSHDTLLGSADIDASLAYNALIKVFEILVDGPGAHDPSGGSDVYFNPDLLGADLAEPDVESTAEAGVYTVSQRGLGRKRFDELQNNPLTGGFTLLNGDKFYGGDMWFVTLYSKVPAVTSIATQSTPADIIDKTTATVTLLLADFNKQYNAAYAGLVQKFVLPDLATVADGKYLILNSHKFTGNYVWVDLSAGGTIFWNGLETNYFYFPADMVIHVQVKGNKLHLVGGTDPRLVTRGDAISSYQATRRGFIQAIGQTLTKADYPGLYQMVADLPPGVAASFAEWDDLDADLMAFNKSRWALDAVGFQIIVPDLRNQFPRWLKLAADTERAVNVPGSRQVDKLKSHGHAIASSNGAPSGNGTADVVRATTAGTVANPRGLAATVGDDNHTIKLSGGVETRPVNAGFVPLITL